MIKASNGKLVSNEFSDILKIQLNDGYRYEEILSENPNSKEFKPVIELELTNEALCQMQAYRVCLKENHDMDVDRFIALYVYPDQPAYPVHASGEALTIYENLWTKRLRNFADQQLWQ